MTTTSKIVVRQNPDGLTWDIGRENDEGFEPTARGYATEAAAENAVAFTRFAENMKRRLFFARRRA